MELVENPPMLSERSIQEVAEGVHVIPDHRVPFVPNVGIVVGEHTVLVVDTGTGPRNAQRVLAEARRLAGERQLMLTVTHFHPEHGFGAQSFVREGTLFYNRAQLVEFREKRQDYLEMFSGFGPGLAELLSEVEFVEPDLTFDGHVDLDLGGVAVSVQTLPGHTRGDQVVWLPQQRVVFAGDLVVTRMFPILPDPDADGPKWLHTLDQVRALGPDVVVPGHGEVGGPELIDAIATYLLLVEQRVRELVAEGKDTEEIVGVLEPELLSRYEDWDMNQEWVRSAIESFHGHAAS